MFNLLISRRTLLPALALLMFGLGASAAKADQVFVTPVGATTSGGSVNAKVTFSQAGNVLTIKLENLQGQEPNYDVSQAISGLSFSIAGAGAATLSQTGEHITIAGDGSFTSAGVGPTFWGFPVNSGGNFQLTALGFASPGHLAPDELIVGPPNGSNLYTGNGSINGNGPHNPFVKDSLTFTLTFASLPPNVEIGGVTFFFGTTPESITSVPEPTSMFLLGTGIMGLAAGIRRRRRKSN